MHIPRPPGPHPALHQKSPPGAPTPVPPGCGSPGCCWRPPPRPPHPQPSLKRQKEKGGHWGGGSGAGRAPPSSSHRWLLAPLLAAPKQRGNRGRAQGGAGGTHTPPSLPPHPTALFLAAGTGGWWHPAVTAPWCHPPGGGTPGQAPLGPRPTCWDARGGGCWQRLEPGDRPQHVTVLGGGRGGVRLPSMVTAAQMSPGFGALWQFPSSPPGGCRSERTAG